MKKLLPEEIERKSFDIIERRIPEELFKGEKREIVKKIVHTTADFSLVKKIHFSLDAIEVTKRLLGEQKDIFTDVAMVAAGISPKYLQNYKGNVICEIRNKEVAEVAAKESITRSEAAVRYAVERYKNIGIFAIGNAPTALFEVIRLYNAGVIKDVFVIGACVGMVGASDAKRLLIKSAIPSIVIRGKRGGSPIAATILNGLFKLKNIGGEL